MTNVSVITNFAIVNFLILCSNIPLSPAEEVSPSWFDTQERHPQNWLWGSGLEKILHIPMCVVRGGWMGQSFGWDRKNRDPVSQQVCHDKDPSLLKGHRPFTGNGDISIYAPVRIRVRIDPPCSKALSAEHKILQPFTGNSKWKILERVVKPYIIYDKNSWAGRKTVNNQSIPLKNETSPGLQNLGVTKTRNGKRNGKKNGMKNGKKNGMKLNSYSSCLTVWECTPNIIFPVPACVMVYTELRRQKQIKKKTVLFYTMLTSGCIYQHMIKTFTLLFPSVQNCISWRGLSLYY
jgi:hypothetical protein